MKAVSPRCRPAFSLIELLAVMGVVAVLLALGVPAVNSIGGAGKLSSGARLMSNLLTVARSEAINSGSPVQLRVVTSQWQGGVEPSEDPRYRRMSLWRLDRASGQYQQISRWETLPQGIVIEPDPAGRYSFPADDQAGTYFLSSSAELEKLDNVASGNATFDGVAIEFLPNGSMRTGAVALNRVYLLLVEGLVPADGAAVQQTAGGKNWAQVRLAPLTGRISITRPN